MYQLTKIALILTVFTLLTACAGRHTTSVGYEVPDHTYHAMEGNGNSGVYHPY